MKIRMLLEYDGAGFSGWQFQPGLRTIQGELEKALLGYQKALVKRAGMAADEWSLSLTGSGRTDAGVHARGQVASFFWPDELGVELSRMRAALNGILPRDIAVLELSPEALSFDARRSHHRKCYSYALAPGKRKSPLERGRCWHLPELNIPAMIEGAAYFRGTHDFSSFRDSDCCSSSTVRTVLSSEVSRSGTQLLTYSIVGWGFLKQMVRIIVGSLVQVGQERLSPEEIPKILKARNRRLAGPTAPAHGLVLEWVEYEEAIAGE
jgi:tRNA pseudouridine38-40 synthase